MIKLTGLIPAVYTPFHEDGSLNLTQIQPYADLLIADGADGVFVCGSTGECASMTVEE
ncbi:MAG: dihydrodipicolinate synthase family protein, partial [Alistipes sp.]|nr:dihydrodipicolinate synthase family protein [Alistipes sp.]